MQRDQSRMPDRLNWVRLLHHVSIRCVWKRMQDMNSNDLAVSLVTGSHDTTCFASCTRRTVRSTIDGALVGAGCVCGVTVRIVLANFARAMARVRRASIISACVCVCVCVCARALVCACLRVCVCVCARARAHVCVHAHVCVRVRAVRAVRACVCACTGVYMSCPEKLA